MIHYFDRIKTCVLVFQRLFLQTKNKVDNKVGRNVSKSNIHDLALLLWKC